MENCRLCKRELVGPISSMPRLWYCPPCKQAYYALGESTPGLHHFGGLGFCADRRRFLDNVECPTELQRNA